MKWCGIYNLSSRPTESGYCLRCLLANFRAALSLTLFNVVSDKFKWKCNEICLLSSLCICSGSSDHHQAGIKSDKWVRAVDNVDHSAANTRYKPKCQQCCCWPPQPSDELYIIETRDTRDPWWPGHPGTPGTWSGSPSPPCPSSRSPPCSRSPQPPSWQVTLKCSLWRSI